MDRETKDYLDQRFERLMSGIAHQFEEQQKYMDRRFNEVMETLDFRNGNHERRIKRLERAVFEEN